MRIRRTVTLAAFQTIERPTWKNGQFAGLFLVK